MVTATSGRFKVIGLWAFRVIVAAAFAMFGVFKLSGVPMMVQEFDVIGLGQWFRYFTGSIEVGGAILLLIPATWRFGSLAVFGVSLGACAAQIFLLHGEVIHTVALIALTGLMAWLAWKPLARA